jgi:hypothetical protein
MTFVEPIIIFNRGTTVFTLDWSFKHFETNYEFMTNLNNLKKCLGYLSNWDSVAVSVDKALLYQLKLNSAILEIKYTII